MGSKTTELGVYIHDSDKYSLHYIYKVFSVDILYFIDLWPATEGVVNVGCVHRRPYVLDQLGHLATDVGVSTDNQLKNLTRVISGYSHNSDS